jgi:hypothetical protein
MKSRVFLVSLFATAIGVYTLQAEVAPRLSASEVNPLRERCQRLLEIHKSVYEDTKALHKIVEARTDKKANSDDEQAALKLASRIKELVAEVTKIIDTMEKEKNAVAFPEFFRIVRDNMKAVQSRLEKTDIGDETQAREKEIIQDLAEMTAALRSR